MTLGTPEPQRFCIFFETKLLYFTPKIMQDQGPCPHRALTQDSKGGMEAHDSLWNMFLGQDFFRKNVICLGYRSSCESNFGYTRFEYFTSTRGGFRNKVAFRICVSCDKVRGLQIYGPVYARPRRRIYNLHII